MKAFIFPGQGAQRRGMGAGLFESFPDLSQTADRILGYSIRELCLEDPGEKLRLTEYTQPAVFVVNALAYLDRIRSAPKPAYLMGHSVAEYDALFAAGVLEFESALRLVKKRGELMAASKRGGMAAVLGLDAAAVERLLVERGLENIRPANFNSPRQIVVSGDESEIARAESFFRDAGATHYIILNVSGAFHTPYMGAAREEFARFAATIEFGAPAIPVISNVTARPHRTEEIRQRMIDQITEPVQWCESIRYVLAQGIDARNFEEIGTQGVAVVKTMVLRTAAEAGPLSAEELRSGPARTAGPEPSSHSAGANLPGTTSLKCSGRAGNPGFAPESLGSRAFREEFNLKYTYLSGGMYQGIASPRLVTRMAQAGLMGFFGTGGLSTSEIESGIREIQAGINGSGSYGVNFLAHADRPEIEETLADLLIRYGVTTAEASAFMQISPALVRYRLNGLTSRGDEVVPRNRIFAKISRPEIAEQFLAPAPEPIVAGLLRDGRISRDEAELARRIPIADALTIEADSGGHTDSRMPLALIPAFLKLRDDFHEKHGYTRPIHVGAAGGIGTPEAAAAVFVMGVDYILTGSINQCTVEAGTSDLVKEMLESMNVQDTDYAPAGDLFELGARVQVLKKGVFFPARANKLLAVYRQHGSLEEIDAKTRAQIQERFLKRSFDEAYREAAKRRTPAELERLERHPKQKMGFIFKRYFRYTTDWALAGSAEHQVDFQVHCGPALGACNQWLKGTELASWRHRHVDGLAERMMHETARILGRRFTAMME